MQMKIEDDLRDALARASTSANPSADAWERVERRSSEPLQPSTGKRIVVALVAALIGLGGVVVATRAFDGGGANVQQSPVTSHGPIGSVETFDIGWDASESSSAISSLDGYAWEAGNQHSALVAPSGELTPLPFKQAPFGLASSSSATWAAGFEPGFGDYVARFPAGSSVPDLTIPMAFGVNGDVVATDNAVWIFGYDHGGDDGKLGSVVRLDPNTGTVLKKLALNSLLPPDISTDSLLYATSGDDAGLWLLIAEIRNGELGQISLLRVDATTYETKAYDPGDVSKLLAGDGAVWLPGQHGPVRLDPSTGGTTELDIPDRGAYPFAVSQDAVWFLGGSATRIELFRLDLVNGQPAGVGLHVSVDRKSSWGSVDASFDGAGSVWLLYESGPLQEVQVGG
jgi:hypothetical protein